MIGGLRHSAVRRLSGLQGRLAAAYLEIGYLKAAVGLGVAVGLQTVVEQNVVASWGD
jgi:hypothetical protein